MMTVGNKISLVYSALTIVLVATVGLLCRLAVGNYCVDLYFKHLEEKARFVAMERFEQDELDSTHYQQLITNRANAVSTDRCVIINLADTDSEERLREFFSPEQILRLNADSVLHAEIDQGTARTDDDEICAAIIYDDNEGTFAVLLFSHNPYLRDLSQTIGIGLIIVVIITSLLLCLLSRLYAAKTVDNIDRAYQTERLFVNNASHEINNPLTSILGECDIALLKERTPEEYRRSLKRISAATERVTNIIKQLLRLSKAGDKSTVNLSTISVSDFLQQYQSDRITLEVDEDFSLTIDVDALRISLDNLVGNALKFSDPNTVKIRVLRRRIQIIDNGIGIPAADLPHVFSPFYRASNAASAPGHGIGLALTKSLLQRCGAEVELRSDGEGTVAEVYFSHSSISHV